MAIAPCPFCAQPTTTGKRFCRHCGAQLPAACPACGAINAPDARFCEDCGNALGGATAVTPTIAATPRTPAHGAGSFAVSAIPDAPSASSSAAAPPEQERRLVTILFADLVGSTTMGETLDAEEAQLLVSAAHTAFAEAIAHYGGYVAKYLGDGVMALFGAPTAREDDAERAVLAGLALHNALERVNQAQPAGTPPLRLRVGVTSGEVIAGPMGGGQYDVSGDAANTAARLQSAAEVGSVLVGADTMALAQRRIDFGERQELRVKGKARPVAAYPALGVRESTVERREHGVGMAPLIGRARQLTAILHAWQRARTGQGSLVTMMGEAGVGKSRLLSEAVERIRRSEADAVEVVRGRCLSYGEAISLWLISDLLRHLCGLTESAVPEQISLTLTERLNALLCDHDEETRLAAVDVCGSALGLPAGPSVVTTADARVRRQVLVRSLRLVLAALAERRPVVLMLEDLHWIDAASSEVLSEVLSDVPGLRLLVLATHRPGWIPPWSAWSWPERVNVAPLGPDDTSALVRALLGDAAVAPELNRYLTERAEGNPFFIEELVQALHEGGDLQERNGQLELAPGAAARVPATLTEVLLARLDRLDREVRSLAQVASVIGRTFAVRLLARIMDQNERLLETPLLALQRAEIAFPRRSPALEYVFKHATVRDVAYNTLLFRRRQALHAAVAQAIESLYPMEEYVELIAYHYERTSDHARAAQWLERAGDRAAAGFANAAALLHYAAARRRAQDAATSLPDQVGALSRLDEKMGDLHMVTGEYAQAQADFAQARARSTAPARRMDLWRKEGETWDRRGEYDRALACFAAAEQEGAMSSEAIAGAEATVSADGAGAENTAGKQESSDILDPIPSSVRAALGLSWGAVYFRRGDLDRAQAAAEQVLALLDAEGSLHSAGLAVAQADNLLGVVAYYRGDLERAADYYRRSLALREQLGEYASSAVSWNNLGGIAMLQGDLAEAEHCYRRSLALGERIGDQQRMAWSWNTLGEVAFERGDMSAAEDYYRRSLAVYERTGDQYGVAGRWLNLGAVSCERGDVAAAASRCRAARRLGHGMGAPDLEALAMQWQACALLRGMPAQPVPRSRLRAINALLARCRALITKHRLEHFTVSLELLTAQLRLREAAIRPEALAQALAAAEQARQLAGSGGVRREEAQAQRTIGQIALARGAFDEADEQLRLAMARFAEIGSTLELARAQLTLAEVLLTRSSSVPLGGGAPDRDDVQEAHALLSAARATFAASGAAWDLEQAKRIAAGLYVH